MGLHHCRLALCRGQSTLTPHPSSHNRPTNQPPLQFSHQLKFNSVADWKDHYIHYANLKKLIYEIARLEQPQRASEDVTALALEAVESGELAEPLLARRASARAASAAASAQAQVRGRVDGMGCRYV